MTATSASGASHRGSLTQQPGGGQEASPFAGEGTGAQTAEPTLLGRWREVLNSEPFDPQWNILSAATTEIKPVT